MSSLGREIRVGATSPYLRFGLDWTQLIAGWHISFRPLPWCRGVYLAWWRL